MFKIGDFAKIAGIAPSQLRYYDERGLFSPIHSDPTSGYRYYSVDQLPSLNRILALRDLGLTLGQIGRLMDDNIAADEIRGMLKLRQADLEQQVRDDLARLRRVEHRLQQIEQPATVNVADVVLKSVPSQWLLSKREHFAATEFSKMLDLFADVKRLTTSDTSRILSTPLSVVHGMGDGDTVAYDIEMGFVLHQPEVPAALRNSLHLSVRQAGGYDTVAAYVHRGPVGDGAYAMLARWVEQQHFTLVGPIRELYLRISHDLSDPDTLIEYQFPVQHQPIERIPLP